MTAWCPVLISDIRRTGINELGNSITLWRRDGPVMISFDDLWSAITHGGQ